ncbi:unnamed protein product [Cunninghamella blakesleeana]
MSLKSDAEDQNSHCSEESNSNQYNMMRSQIQLPNIPVVMRYPTIISSVEQYKSEYHQQQLQKVLVSESFIPVTPNAIKLPRKRRRPPFSYSSLIAQAILESEHERLTLREVYQWIVEKYPALYNADDIGWQNTIRHNLSLNKCFKKVPKSELDGSNRGKGGYWTIDPSQMSKFKNGAFARGSSSTLRRSPPLKPSQNKQSIDIEQQSNSSTPSYISSTTLASTLNSDHNNNYINDNDDKNSNNNNDNNNNNNTPSNQEIHSPSLPLYPSNSVLCTMEEKHHHYLQHHQQQHHHQQHHQQHHTSPPKSSSFSFKSTNCNDSPISNSTVMKIQNILN